MGGTGGSSTVEQTNVNQRPELKKYQQFEQRQLDRYTRKSPLLSRAETGAMGFWDQLGAQLSGLQEQFGGISKDLQSQFGGLPEYLMSNFGEGSAAMDFYKGDLSDTIRGGGYSAELDRDARNESLAWAGASGNSYGNQAGIAQWAARQAQKDKRLNTALGQAAGIQQGQTGLAQAAQGLGTGLAGTRQGLGMGLASGLQGLQTGGLNQLLGVETSEVANYTTLMNPAKQFLSNILGLKSQESIGQAQINQEGNIADQNKQTAMAKMAIEGAGTIAGAAMSDERLKQKIRDTGIKSESGATFKRFEYKTRPGVEFIGFTAQDVEEHDPGSVFTDPRTGIKSVGFKYFPVELGKEAA